MTRPTEVFVGIDVSKDILDGAASDGRTTRVPQTAAGPQALVAQLRQWGVTLVVLEATGGFETAVTAALAPAGLAVAVINPRPARDFARAVGQRAKTDRIAARLLAEFAQRVRPEPRPLPDADARELDAWLDRRRQLVAMRTMETNRLSGCPQPRVRQDLEAPLKWLDERIDPVDRDLGQRIARSPLWRTNDELLQGIPGIGSVVSRTLLAAAVELGRLNRHAIAALAGLAPRADDSGRRTGVRSIQGGRGLVRSTLSMAALTARRFKPVLRAFADRLARAGKRPEVILTAVARKLLIIANALIRSRRRWDPNWAAAVS